MRTKKREVATTAAGVTINAAMTVDGKIATASGDSKISSRQDLERVHRLRARSDAVIVGISTILADDPLLTVRLVKGRNPARVIVDSRGRIPAGSRILRTARSVRTIVAVAENQAPEESLAKIRDTGAEVLVVKEGKEGQSAAVPQGVDLKELFSVLKQRGFRRILVEGGGELNWSLLRLGLVGNLIVTVAPVVAGGRLATTLVEGDGSPVIRDGIKLELRKMVRDRKTGELVLYYRVLP